MLKIPYGISSFAELRNDNYFYADKTEYIKLLESYGEKYIFFLRPRRFGKTLFLSTLENYYDLNKKEEFAELFSDLYIGENKTKLANSYHILRFDFSSVATTSEEELLYTFLVKVQKAIEVFINKYNLDLQCPESHDPASMLNLFMARVQGKIDQEIYVLIDEYDQFANEMLGEENSKFKKAVSQTGFVRRFYQALKEATADGVVDRIFATGVSPITLDSMTSGFNIAAKLTREPDLNEMMGFTAGELKPLLNSLDISESEKKSLMDKLKEYYNGYLFHQDAKSKVFNSDMVLYFFKYYLRQHKEPEDLIDSNISSDYRKLEQLFALNEEEKTNEILESILNEELQDVVFTREFSLDNRFNADDFKSLLFYLGFLTIKEKTPVNIKLGLPNYAIKEIYFEFFSKIIEDYSGEEIFSSETRKTVAELALNGNIEPLVEEIEVILNSLSNRDLILFDEKYIKLLFISYLILSKFYNVKSEYEVENGYIDLVLFKKEIEAVNYEALIELKYIKKSDYQKQKEKLLSKKIKEAKKQLLSYGEAEEFKQKENFKKWIIIFAGAEVVHLEEI